MRYFYDILNIYIEAQENTSDALPNATQYIIYNYCNDLVFSYKQTRDRHNNRCDQDVL